MLNCLIYYDTKNKQYPLFSQKGQNVGITGKYNPISYDYKKLNNDCYLYCKDFMRKRLHSIPVDDVGKMSLRGEIVLREGAQTKT